MIMDPNIITILSSIYLWVIVVSVIGGYISLRIAGRNRDKAALADHPDQPEKFVLRARLWYAVFIVFLLALIGSLGIVVFQVLQITRPSISIPFLIVETEATPELTATEPAATPSPTIVSRTATPAPTRTPFFTPTPTVSILNSARIGNTDFQGANVREGPSLDSSVVAKLRNGTMVFLTERATVVADDFVWQQIRLEDGAIGWIVSWFLIVD
jgi:hypothetical protein